MHQLFYILTVVFIVAWIILLATGILGDWAHLVLAVAVLSMTIGLFRRSAGN